jgi:hypothetical protein
VSRAAGMVAGSGASVAWTPLNPLLNPY